VAVSLCAVVASSVLNIGLVFGGDVLPPCMCSSAVCFILFSYLNIICTFLILSQKDLKGALHLINLQETFV
jgi:hypothetical protein